MARRDHWRSSKGEHAFAAHALHVRGLGMATEAHLQHVTPAPAREEHAPRVRPPSRIRSAFVWLRRLYDGLDRTRAFGVAAQMAFWLFLAMIPLAVVAGWVVARFAVAHADVVSDVFAATPGAATSWMSQQVSEVASWNGGTVAPVATVVFVWLASSGIHAVFDGLEVQVGAPRPWWKKRLLAIATCVGLSVGVALTTLLVTGLDWLTRFFGAHLPAAFDIFQHGGVAVGVRVIIGLLLFFGLIAGMYWVGVPQRKKRGIPIVPGAIVASLIVFATGYGYGLYLSKVGVSSAYQAGLAIIAVTMTTLYLFSVALLVGAEVNCLRSTRCSSEARAAA